MKLLGDDPRFGLKLIALAIVLSPFAVGVALMLGFYGWRDAHMTRGG